MHILCSVPCALNPAQVRVIFRDMCRALNYSSLDRDRDVACMTATGVVVEGWRGQPQWMRSAEVRQVDGEVTLHMDVFPDVEPCSVKEVQDNLKKQLSELLSRPIRPFRTRVFCIGWSKTGTTSITEALRILGLFSWRSAPWILGHKNFQDDVSSSRIDFEGIADYTAVSDLPVCALYKELDAAFPRSLFIFTTRDVDAWLSSAVVHYESNMASYGARWAVERWAYGTDRIDKDVLRARYMQHQEEVLKYFLGRKDFLVIDITRGDPWPQLCEFLDLPVPEVPFPHLNRRVIR
jgi:hypothetical protein